MSDGRTAAAGGSDGGDGAALLRFLMEVADAAAGEAETLNRLDGVAGDGDLGVTATRIATVLHEVAPSLEALPVAELLRDAGRAIGRQAASTFGTLLAQAIIAAGKPEVGDATAGTEASIRLHAARESVAARGRVEPGDRTMLDALAPADDAFANAIGEGRPLLQALREAAEAAEAGAVATSTMAPTVGRAGWLRERATGHQDAGARLVALSFAAAAEAAASGGSER